MKNLGRTHGHGDIFYLTLDENGKIEHSKYDFTQTTPEGLQQFVDKLIRLKMITLVEGKQTTVSVCVWGIDETDDYYIETFHSEMNDVDLSDYDVTMKFDEFLNL